MGIPGILKEIGKGQRTALAKLAIEHLEQTQRPLRIAIDAAIWNFQHQASQGGKNPALRTLFFRLLKLLALPIHPVFVYDGKNKPLTKRGRTVNRYTTCIPNEMSKQLVQVFQFPHHTAPGEAEAECAFLQHNGLVDAVMSQDVDAIMFGSTLTLRDWSKEGTRGNKSPTHVSVLDSPGIKAMSGLDPEGMILVALLSGGDYDEAGVAGFGSALACEIARAGFGADLLELVRKNDGAGLDEWRQRLQYELETNESGHFKKRHKTLKVPEDFPNLTILSYYTSPAVSETADLPALAAAWSQMWDSEIDVPALRDYTARTLDWTWKSGARRFVRCFAQPLFQDRLRRGVVKSASFPINSITERRQHFVNDAIPELRLSVIPADVVGIDIEAEDDNPEYVAEQNEGDDNDDNILLESEEIVTAEGSEPSVPAPPSPSKKKSSAPWDPYLVEKWWIPETLMQLGLPATVEEWHQLQRDIHADPKRFATRKALRTQKNTKQVDSCMKAGSIRAFFSQVEKPIQKSVSVELETVDVVAGTARFSKPSGRGPLHTQHKDDSANNGLESQKSHFGFHAGPVELSKKVRPVTGGKARTLASSKRSCPTSFAPGATCDNSEALDSVRPHQTKASTFVLSDSLEQIPTDEDLSTCVIDGTVSIRSSQATIGDSDTYQLPPPQDQVSNITQRTPRRSRNRKGLSSDVSASSTRRPRPIESFFASLEAIEVVSVAHEDIVCQPTLNQSIPPSDAPRNLKSRPSRRPALPRESLPGAWKETDVDQATRRSAPRVSYVDLTLD